MRVLLVANLSPLRCGEKEFALIWAEELEKLGVEVTLCNGGAEFGCKLPSFYAKYDLIHFNWGPQQMGHWGAQHIPSDAPPLSIFLHDVPPNSECFLLGSERVKLLMSYEEMEGSVVLDHAVPTYLPLSKPSEEIVIGVTGIRGDGGPALVKAACERNGWGYSAPDWWSERSESEPAGAWLTSEEEIERLARSTLNVCWYHTSGRGKSMGAMFCLAARRPLVLSGSTMFSHLWPYSDEIMICRESHDEPGFYEAQCEPALELALAKIAEGWPLTNRVVEELSWARLAERIKGLWEGAGR